MARVRHILFHGVALTSLLLCVAAALLWVRSRWVRDAFTWSTADSPYPQYGYTSCMGIVTANCWELNEPPPRGPEFDHLVRKVDPQFAADYRDSLAENTWHGFAYRHWDTGGADRDLHLRYYWAVPLWFVVLITGALPAAAFRRRFRGIRQSPGLCPACGYDLRATPERCPECGTIARR
jgi:hypothetical protein